MVASNIRRVGVAGLALALVLLSVPAAGARADAWDARRAVALDAARRTRALVTTGRLADVVRAGAALRGIDALSALPSTSTARTVPGVPIAIAAPVADLLAALDVAAAAARTAVPSDPGFAARADAALLAQDAGAIATLAAAVDEEQLDAAGLTVAAAVDAALPLLRAAAASMTSTADAVEGCDLVDQAPALCLGGTGANTYKNDYALQIDLGGNDRYANAAGGADPTGNGIAAAVAIDLGGDDTYDATLPTAAGARAAQGGVNLGGVGVLVDVVGDDRYQVTSARGDVSAYGQGFGSAGVGVLADLAGNDDYRLTYAPPAVGTGVRNAYGLGYSTLAGVGVVLDPAGNDRYRVEARPVPGIDEWGEAFGGRAHVQGIGVGIAGSGMLIDGGGTDELVLEAVGEAPEGHMGGLAMRAGASAQGLGVGEVAGVGLLLTGTGATTYRAHASAGGPETGGAKVEALAIGGLAGLGVVEDLGGNDTYAIDVTTEADRALSVDDSCECDRADASTVSGAAAAVGMGFASLGASALLHDAAGNDTYAGAATTSATSTARSDRTSAPVDKGPAAVATATAGAAVSRVLGVGAMNPSASLVQSAGALLLEDGAGGFVLDAGGDDTYTSIARATASADATAAVGEAAESASTWKAATEGQAMGGGGGYGELRDTGGTDSYRSVSDTDATVAHDWGVAAPGPERVAVQGSGPSFENSELPAAALLVDVDGGAKDVFSAVPADPTCYGTRGQGAWQDCDSDAAGGVNA